MKTVLFLCTQNAARSQMAEGFLKHYADDRFEVYSAGLEPTQINPLAIQVMKEVGIDISGHYSKSVKEYLGKLSTTYAIFVCANAEENCPRIHPFALHELFWPFDDPASCQESEEVRIQHFRRIRDQIEKRIKEWLKSL
jgi:arsenate reductase (thioredoxin)